MIVRGDGSSKRCRPWGAASTSTPVCPVQWSGSAMPTAEMAIRTHAHSRLHHEQRLRHTPIISPLRDLEPACYGDMLVASGAGGRQPLKELSWAGGGDYWWAQALPVRLTRRGLPITSVRDD